MKRLKPLRTSVTAGDIKHRQIYVPTAAFKRHRRYGSALLLSLGFLLIGLSFMFFTGSMLVTEKVRPDDARYRKAEAFEGEQMKHQPGLVYDTGGDGETGESIETIDATLALGKDEHEVLREMSEDCLPALKAPTGQKLFEQGRDESYRTLRLFP